MKAFLQHLHQGKSLSLDGMRKIFLLFALEAEVADRALLFAEGAKVFQARTLMTGDQLKRVINKLWILPIGISGPIN